MEATCWNRAGQPFGITSQELTQGLSMGNYNLQKMDSQKVSNIQLHLPWALQTIQCLPCEKRTEGRGQRKSANHELQKGAGRGRGTEMKKKEILDKAESDAPVSHFCKRH